MQIDQWLQPKAVFGHTFMAHATEIKLIQLHGFDSISYTYIYTFTLLATRIHKIVRFETWFDWLRFFSRAN